MGDKGRSERNLTGGFTHYDTKGHKIGHSDPAFFGGYSHYDTKGHKTGHSDPSLLGGYNHYDSSGKKLVQVIRLFSEGIQTILLQVAVTSQPVFTDRMIALRFGLFAVSGIFL